MLEVGADMLVDSFTYFEYLGEDDYQETSYAEPIDVENVRIDRSEVFSRDSSQTKVVADSVIFCYASSTTPFKTFKEQSKVVFDGKEMVIQKVITLKEPFANRVWAYELEVL